LPTLQGDLVKPAEADRLKQLTGAADAAAAIADILARKDWFEDAAAAQAMEAPMLRLCAHYLIKEKRGETAHDRVAHFHLSNGARVERINWLANLSPAGVAQSAGMMVNIESNHEAYRGKGRIAASTAVRRLLRM
jgi:malonyl-CoA decarboxylase